MTSNMPNFTELMERLNSVNFRVPEYDPLLAMLQHQLEQAAVRIDTEQPWGPGNRAPLRAVIVTGAHHSGTSDLVLQCVEALQPVTSGDGKVIEPAPRTTSAPFVFTQASQARAISAALDYPFTRRMTADMAWERVFHRMADVHVQPLVIDNWHRSFTPAQVGQRKYDAECVNIQSSYVSLLEHATAPLGVVLVGRSEALQELKKPGMEKLPDNSDSLEVARMVNENAEHERLQMGLSKLCDEAGLELSLYSDDKPFQRLIHASDHVRGTAIVLCKLAVLHAVRMQAGRLEFKHLEAAYLQSMNGALAMANPFNLEDWTKAPAINSGIKTSLMDEMRRRNHSKEDENA